MISDIAARRYAYALFALGREQGSEALDQYGTVLTALDQALTSTPELGRLFRAPVISAAEKQKTLTRILDAMHAGQVMHNFCRLLAEKERLPLLQGIANAFSTLLDEARGVVRGKLMTAVALDAKRRTALVHSLEKKIGKKIELQFKTDPAILGGVVLHVGDKVFDASLKAQLNVLKDTIKRGE